MGVNCNLLFEETHNHIFPRIFSFNHKFHTIFSLPLLCFLSTSNNLLYINKVIIKQPHSSSWSKYSIFFLVFFCFFFPHLIVLKLTNMCIQDSEQVNEAMENLDISKTDNNFKNQSLLSKAELQHTQIQNYEKITTSSHSVMRNSFPVRIFFFFFNCNICLYLLFFPVFR